MQGLGGVDMKGRLSKRMGCGCCTFHNFKKINVLNDKSSFKKEAYKIFNKKNNGADEYPPLKQLFKDHDLYILLDHPCGEDVVYVDGKFEGYADDWLKSLKFSEENNIKYESFSEIYLIHLKSVF